MIRLSYIAICIITPFLWTGFNSGYAQNVSGYYSLQTDYEIGSVSHTFGSVIPSRDKGVIVGICPLYSPQQQAITTLFKLDSALNFVWGTDIDWLYEDITLGEDHDGSIILASTDSMKYAYLSKLAPDGTLLWTRKCTEPSYGESLLVLDSCYYLMGHIHNPGTYDEKKFVTKFSADGQVIWSKLYHTNYNGFIQDAMINEAGQLAILGTMAVDNQVFGTHILVIDTAGTIIWSRAYNYYDFLAPHNITQNTQGEYGVTGHYDTPFAILFLSVDSLGNLLGSTRFAMPSSQTGTDIFHKDDHFLISVASRNYLDTYAYRAGFLEVNQYGEPVLFKLKDMDEAGSYPITGFQDSSGIFMLGYGWENKQFWIDHNSPAGDFPCKQEIEDIPFELLTLTQQTIPLTVYDSVSYVDFSTSQVPFQLSFSVDCYQPPPSENGSGDTLDTTPVDWATVHIPNVFTPDGDQVNDYFTINYEGNLPFQLEILNRWGETLFISQSPQNVWNGHIANGNIPVSAGVYFYKVTIGDSHKHGYLTLIY